MLFRNEQPEASFAAFSPSNSWKISGWLHLAFILRIGAACGVIYPL